MVIKLSRTTILIITISVIAVYLVLNRMNAIRERVTTTGEITEIKKLRSSGLSKDISYVAIISYSVGSEKYKIETDGNKEMKTGEKFEIIYRPDAPEDGTTFDFKGFWMGPVMYCIIPLLFLSAFILAFIDKKDIVSFNFKNGLKISKSKKEAAGKIKKFEANSRIKYLD